MAEEELKKGVQFEGKEEYIKDVARRSTSRMSSPRSRTTTTR